MSFVQELPDCPMDIVGDIHGEYEALSALLHTLGYQESGRHPEDRRLVFTGDLVDRGHDSPAVMDFVIELVEAGLAYCVLGNHELNILRGVRKGGNDWILDAGVASASEHVVATAAQAARYREFLNRQPFVLAGDHLRVVHACWDADAVAALESLWTAGADIGALYRQTEAGIVEKLGRTPLADAKLRELGRTPLADAKLRELERYGEAIADPQWEARLLPAHAEVDMALQMENPLRVLTTSEEQLAAEPFFAGGKWRMTERARWWEHYSDTVPVVIGHFWRLFNDDARRITGMFGADVFEGTSSHEWMGRRRNVYCVDYSVGQRYLERQRESLETFHGKLAALRYPEWEVVHDDGTRVPIGEPGQGSRASGQ